MAHINSVGQQRFFKGEGAANQKGHQIIAPDIFDVQRLGVELAVLPDTVTREVRAQINRAPKVGTWN